MEGRPYLIKLTNRSYTKLQTVTRVTRLCSLFVLVDANVCHKLINLIKGRSL